MFSSREKKIRLSRSSFFERPPGGALPVEFEYQWRRVGHGGAQCGDSNAAQLRHQLSEDAGKRNTSLLFFNAAWYCGRWVLFKKKKEKKSGELNNKKLPTVPKLDVQMECSRLSSRLTGLEPGGSKVTTLGPLKRQRCVATKEPQRGGKKVIWPSQCSHSVQLRYKTVAVAAAFTVAPPPSHVFFSLSHICSKTSLISPCRK